MAAPSNHKGQSRRPNGPPLSTAPFSYSYFGRLTTVYSERASFAAVSRIAIASFRVAARRIAAKTVCPLRARCTAIASPIPVEHPVIRTVVCRPGPGRRVAICGPGGIKEQMATVAATGVRRTGWSDGDQVSARVRVAMVQATYHLKSKQIEHCRCYEPRGHAGERAGTRVLRPAVGSSARLRSAYSSRCTTPRTPQWSRGSLIISEPPRIRNRTQLL